MPERGRRAAGREPQSPAEHPGDIPVPFCDGAKRGGGVHALACQWAAVLLAPLAAWAVSNAVPPFCRYFDPADHSIGYPHVEEATVPTWTLPIVAAAAPAAAALFAAGLLPALCSRPYNGAAREAHAVIYTLVLALALSVCVSEPIKTLAGRLRPDFMARLRLGGALGGASEGPVSWQASCNNHHSIVLEGRRSFPSGHSSLSFAAWGTVALLAGSGFQRAGGAPRAACQPLAALAWVLPACFIAVSRTRDYRHDFVDITAGALIGLCSALAAASAAPDAHSPRAAREDREEGSPLLPLDAAV
eukprot:TRINITY_DN70226_c0_g1_i1.p1 TRINITY_DN70226_c0_g1~~TRINITY_DN70226_c0_g1_i1.p1  ORF type:complete len:327 (+),score=83.94 TRINITY_DN70226_c0_g1_i1:74-982(+)